MKVCKHCGEINTNDSSFCCNCGQSNFIIQQEVVCHHCGAINDKSYVHCVNCGTPLAEVSPTAPVEQDYTPVAVNVRDGLTSVYEVGLTSLPSEMARCPHCGNLVPITAIFCNKCGASVANLHSHRVVQRKVCPHCGRPNTMDANLCTYCFASLLNAETEEMQVIHDTQNLGDVTIRQTYLESSVNGKKLICSNCGTLNNPEEAFCVNCGLIIVVDAPKKYCPNCGAENPVDSSFCSRCQWSFDGSSPDSDSTEKWTCPYCDTTCDENDLYCPNCGEKRE